MQNRKLMITVVVVDDLTSGPSLEIQNEIFHCDQTGGRTMNISFKTLCHMQNLYYWYSAFTKLLKGTTYKFYHL